MVVLYAVLSPISFVVVTFAGDALICELLLLFSFVFIVVALVVALVVVVTIVVIKNWTINLFCRFLKLLGS